MEILFSATARRQLLSLVARLRERDRRQAERLVDGIEERLLHLAETRHGGTAADLERALAATGEGVRLFWWTRAGVLWVLALSHPLLHPEP